MQDIQDERYYEKSVSLSHDALLWAFWAPWYRKVMLRLRRTLQAVRPRGAVLMVQIGMESHHHGGGFPAIKKGPCHDLPRINGKITRNTGIRLLVCGDIWIFRFVLCIPPDYVKPLKRIDWKQDTLPIWWLKQGRLRSAANYVFSLFFWRKISNLCKCPTWIPHWSIELLTAQLSWGIGRSQAAEKRGGRAMDWKILEDNSNHPTLRSAGAYPPMSSWHHGKSGWFPSFQY